MLSNMDFSYFTAAPQPYHFFGLPPTPGGSTTPPQVDEYGTNQSSDQYSAAFSAFQQAYQYDPASFLTQQSNLPQASPPKRDDSIGSLPETNANALRPITTDLSQDDSRARSSSEEKDTLTPAQSRRKAQNRAAQRAFRERKERHVKDLEAKLTDLEHQSASLNGENERLKRELAKISTENKILRATSGSNHSSKGRNAFASDMDREDSDEITSTGPMRYSPTEFYSKNSSSRNSPSRNRSPGSHSQRRRQSLSHRITVSSETGERLLAAGATWDYIQEHELFRKGLVDVGDVCERLKKVARCDGQGPVFEEEDVRNAVMESAVAGGRDELI